LFAGVFVGIAVMWLGTTFALRRWGIVERGWWPYFLLGLGVLFLLGGVVMLFMPDMKKGAIGMFIPGLVLGVLGIIPALIGGWSTWWPLIIVAGGVVIIVSVLWSVLGTNRKEK